ncbi:MAG: VWA domain-containing protein, partial [Candidatus Aenigmatarchaeota archaeon]
MRNILSNKGQVSFVVKALIIIMIIIAFVLVVGNTGYFFKETKETKESLDFRSNSLVTLQNLIYNDDCLANSFKDTVMKGVLEKDKIENFTKIYNDTEPECARLYPHDYSVEVKQMSGEYNIYPEALYRSRILLLIDKSGSMECCMNPSCPYLSWQKPCCDGGREKFQKVKDAVKILINQLGSMDKIGLVSYSSNAKVDSPLTENHNKVKQKLEGLNSCGGTNIGASISKGFGLLPQTMVLLSDGCFTSGKDPRQIAKDVAASNIPVFTIGLGEEMKQKCRKAKSKSKATYSYTGEEVLQEIAEMTGGKYFFARTPDQLPKIYMSMLETISQTLRNKTREVKIKERTWSFGVDDFSKGDLLKEEITLTAPISIKYNSSRYTRGRIYLTVRKGELEKLSSTLEKFCGLLEEKGNASSYTTKIYLSNPVNYKQGKLCMEDGSDTCKKIGCSLPIQFP